MNPLIYLLLPTLASCNIVINIHTSNSSATSSLNIRGADKHVISDTERTTFGITDEVLKRAAENYSGGRPQDVFLHSPTPWNDLYKTYGWREVARLLKPVKSQILDVQSRKVIVTMKEFDNNSTSEVKFDGGLMADVEDVIERKWSKAGKLDIEEPISYNVNGDIVYSFSSPWGTDSVDSKKISLGTNSAVEVVLQPGQDVTAILMATKIGMTLQVDYTANLSGHVACNYPKKYNGHHFWGYEVNALMGAGRLIRTVKSYEVINLQFYTNANILLVDKKSNARLSEVPVEVKRD